MAHIETIPPERATGRLAAIYRAAIERAGRVFGILRVQSQNPATLQASLQLYMATTTSPHNALPRWQRELLATVVSAENHCVY